MDDTNKMSDERAPPAFLAGVSAATALPPNVGNIEVTGGWLVFARDATGNAIALTFIPRK